jgi:hypothetical protein
LDAGADRDALLANVRAAIRGGRPLGPEEDPQRFDDWDDCMAAMQESGHSEAEAERICGSFKEKTEEQTATHNLDDPEFSEGDAVSWNWQGDTVHGRVADIGAEFTIGGTTITGEDGEAVYLIHEFDEDVEAFREENVAKPQSSLSESGRNLPPANEDNMTNDTQDDEPTDEQDAAEDATTQQVRQSPSEITDLAEDIVMGHIERAMDEVREELEDMMGDGGENESDNGDEMDDDEDDEEEQAAEDPDSEQSAGDEDADLQSEVEALRDELDSLRSGGVSADDVETPDADDEQDATDEDGETTDDDRDAEDPIEGLGGFR